MEEEQSVAKLPLIEAECSARLGISNIDYDQDQHGGVGSLDSAGAPVETRSTAVLCICTFAAACAAFTGGCLASYSSLAESGIIADLGLTVAEYSVFGSIMTGGAMLGAVISGRMTDFIGRRRVCMFFKYTIPLLLEYMNNIKTLWVLDIFYIVGWLAIIFAEGAWLLDLGRLSLGIGFGLTCYVGPVYLAEITPKNVRGLLMSISQSMTGYGASFTFLVGSFVTWRSLAIIGCIPSLLLLLALFFIPESPRWLDYIENQRLQQNSDDNVLNLFRRKYLHIVIIGVGLMVVQTSDGLCGFLFYMSEIFDSAGISSTLGFILVAVVQASATGQCLGCFLTGLSYFLQVYMGSYAFGMAQIPWIVVSEILPINVKGSAGTLCNLVNWFCSWVVSYTFNYSFSWSPTGTFFIYAGMCGFGVAFIAKLVPETKGRTLEEIHASLTHIMQ
ncbi:hypothetical protein CIPAW_07G013200 [Carya illinoinensis]|uniref:Major facilitator superfamily (MFS) profile domain-containing protein n=1 Tax=Carya illinoinensis TaxID=32201 RepID=A0A8T1PYI0_CARIL|nr:hypothetical protein CIPAW_07G013200 [Carya illinoinensis]